MPERACRFKSCFEYHERAEGTCSLSLDGPADSWRRHPIGNRADLERGRASSTLAPSAILEGPADRWRRHPTRNRTDLERGREGSTPSPSATMESNPGLVLALIANQVAPSGVRFDPAAFLHSHRSRHLWRVGREADCDRLEIGCASRHRGFKSLTLRHSDPGCVAGSSSYASRFALLVTVACGSA